MSAGAIGPNYFARAALASSEVVDQFDDFGLAPSNGSFSHTNRSRVQAELDAVIERRARDGNPLEDFVNAQQTLAWGNVGCGTHGENLSMVR